MSSPAHQISSLRFCIIGCGRIAQRHAMHIAERGQLIAVCDVVVDKANQMAQLYNATAFYNIQQLLDSVADIDVAVICTPNGLHAEHAIACLRAGMNVLCEKPMAITSGDCRSMMAEEQASGKKLFIVKQNRFNPPVKAVKELLDLGRLGNIYSVALQCFWNRDNEYYTNSWKGTQLLDGGTLFTQFSHFIDLLYWMFGEVTDVDAYTLNAAHQDIIEFEDSGVAILRFKNGAMGTINYSVNAYKKNMEGSLTIIGEKGTVKIGGQYLNELSYQCIEGYTIPQLPAGNPANHYGLYEGSMSNHGCVYENLIAALQQDKPMNANAADGLRTVEIIEAIYTAAKRNTRY